MADTASSCLPSTRHSPVTKFHLMSAEIWGRVGWALVGRAIYGDQTPSLHSLAHTPVKAARERDVRAAPKHNSEHWPGVRKAAVSIILATFTHICGGVGGSATSCSWIVWRQMCLALSTHRVP